MSGFIPDLTTRVSVEIDTTDISDAISRISGTILEDVFTEELEDAKNTLENLKQPLTQAVAEGLQSNQEMIISSKHYITGMMANSVDLSNDGDDILVGNTAMTVDGFPYPLAIETGSKDHWVAPVTFDVLHWTDGGKDYYSKGHMVSGITADPFVEPSIENTMWDIDEIFSDL